MSPLKGPGSKSAALHRREPLPPPTKPATTAATTTSSAAGLDAERNAADSPVAKKEDRKRTAADARGGRRAVAQQDAAAQARLQDKFAPAGGIASTPAKSPDTLAADAKTLRALIKGWTTNGEEKAIVRTLRGYDTPADATRLKATYRKQTGRDLTADIKRELGGFPQKEAAARLAGKPALADAHRLQAAMDRWGTDEAELVATLQGKSGPERGAIESAYAKTYDRTLRDAFTAELSGQALQKANGALNGDLEPSSSSSTKAGPAADLKGAYQPQGVYGDRVSGTALWAVKSAASLGITKGLVRDKMMEAGGFNAFREVDFGGIAASKEPTLPGPAPAETQNVQLDVIRASNTGRGHAPTTASDLLAAFKDPGSGKTPLSNAKAFLDNVDKTSKLNAILPMDRKAVVAAAQQSAERYQAGTQRPLEGLIVPVKNQIDIEGYRTSNGAQWKGPKAGKDAEMVRRLRAAGAIPVPANLSEFGMRTFDESIRNPHDVTRSAGGSSGGSAAAVAAGLTPVAVGSDAGGSTRIPTALSGAGVGLLPTHGRMPDQGNRGVAPQLQQAGPIAATAEDAAMLYSVMAGHQLTEAVNNKDLTGLTVGVYAGWNEHADPDAVKATQATLASLKAAGATVKEIEIHGLNLANRAQMIEYMKGATSTGQLPKDKSQLSNDVQLNLALSDALTPDDEARAQKTRTLLSSEMERVFDEVDLVITPATAQTAPVATGHPVSDLNTHEEMSRFTSLANLTGLPAVVFPGGHDERGLPVGVQAIGKPWSEETLLRVANVAEDGVERKKPSVYVGD